MLSVEPVEPVELVEQPELIKKRMKGVKMTQTTAFRDFGKIYGCDFESERDRVRRETYREASERLIAYTGMGWWEIAKAFGFTDDEFEELLQFKYNREKDCERIQ